MSLPRIKINFANGLLGTVTDSADGLLLLVSNGTAVGSTFAVNTAYEIKRLEALASLGVTSSNNPTIYKMVKEFYSEAPDGTKVVIAVTGSTVNVADMVNKDLSGTNTGFVRRILQQYNGDIKGVIVSGSTTSSVASGLVQDVVSAVPIAQSLAEWAADELKAPIFVILEGRGFTSCDASALTDWTQYSYNRVGVMLGGTESDGSASVGLLAGRIASMPVQRNVGRVKDGALSPTTMYFANKTIENCMDDVESAYDKGYIVCRTYAGKSGYYFADDYLACDRTDDYASLANRRVADKAARIAYTTLLNFMLDEIELNDDGTMQSAVATYWQQSVVNAIDRQMTANGELSRDSDESGCQCTIDTTQDVVSTSKINVALKIRPFGYARFIDVELGFLVTES